MFQTQQNQEKLQGTRRTGTRGTWGWGGRPGGHTQPPDLRMSPLFCHFVAKNCMCNSTLKPLFRTKKFRGCELFAENVPSDYLQELTDVGDHADLTATRKLLQN